MVVLDEGHADAVIEHRQKLRKPLSGYAAKLLAGKLGKCPDPNVAADAMIANGWQGFEPEWLENRRGSRAHDDRQTLGDWATQQLLLGNGDHHAIEHR